MSKTNISNSSRNTVSLTLTLYCFAREFRIQFENVDNSVSETSFDTKAKKQAYLFPLKALVLYFLYSYD